MTHSDGAGSYLVDDTFVCGDPGSPSGGVTSLEIPSLESKRSFSSWFRPRMSSARRSALLFRLSCCSPRHTRLAQAPWI